jgi:hypothetical protein
MKKSVRFWGVFGGHTAPHIHLPISIHPQIKTFSPDTPLERLSLCDVAPFRATEYFPFLDKSPNWDGFPNVGIMAKAGTGRVGSEDSVSVRDGQR